MTGVTDVFGALKQGNTIVSTDWRKRLVCVFDGDQTYTIYRVADDGGWKQLERFYNSSGDHLGAMLDWMLHVEAVGGF